MESMQRNLARKLGILACIFFLPYSSVYAQLASGGVTGGRGFDNPFELYYLKPCLDGPVALLERKWSFEEIIKYNNDICSRYFPGGAFNDGTQEGYQSASNLGTKNAQKRSAGDGAGEQVASVKDRLDELETERKKLGIGFLYSIQDAETDKSETDFESSFESEIDTRVFGIDYRFNDLFVIGYAKGSTDNEIIFSDGGSVLNSDSDSKTWYFTLTPIEGLAVDGYSGSASLSFNGSRHILVEGDSLNAVGFSGAVSSEFDGDQDMKGISISYDWYIGDFAVGPFYAIDKNKTTIDGYEEQGDTGLELGYSEQVSKSDLTTVGVNFSYGWSFGWASLVPTLSYASVHESADDATTYSVRLLALPNVDDTTFEFQTDAPDRRYTLINYGLVLALNQGSQFFVSYEKNSGHDYLDTSAMTLGLLLEF